MQKQKLFYVMMVFIILLFVFIIGFSFSQITGYVMKSDKIDISENPDEIEIPKGELKVCCSFIDTDNREKTCSVFSRFDCGYCTEYC
jgi:hypothetical protein